MTLDALDPIVQDARVWLRRLQGHGEPDRTWLSNFNTYVRRSAPHAVDAPAASGPGASGLGRRGVMGCIYRPKYKAGVEAPT